MAAFQTLTILMDTKKPSKEKKTSRAQAKRRNTSRTQTEKHADVYLFTKLLIGLCSPRELVQEEASPTLNELLRQAKVHWHAVKPDQPDYTYDLHCLAVTGPVVSSRGEA